MIDNDFIIDKAKEYGLDVTVRSKVDKERSKKIYRISTRSDGEKYMSEFVRDLDTVHPTEEMIELQIIELHDTLNAIREAIDNSLPESDP